VDGIAVDAAPAEPARGRGQWTTRRLTAPPGSWAAAGSSPSARESPPPRSRDVPRPGPRPAAACSSNRPRARDLRRLRPRRPLDTARVLVRAPQPVQVRERRPLRPVGLHDRPGPGAPGHRLIGRQGLYDFHGGPSGNRSHVADTRLDMLLEAQRRYTSKTSGRKVNRRDSDRLRLDAAGEELRAEQLPGPRRAARGGLNG